MKGRRQITRGQALLGSALPPAVDPSKESHTETTL
jgi:hypothetical protein